MLTGFVLYILEGAIYRRVWRKGLKARAELTPKSAFCGDKGDLCITLENRKLLPLPWLWIKLHISSSLSFKDSPKPSGAYTYRNALFCIMGWQEIKRTMPFVCTKRGYFPLKSLEVIGTSILFNGKHAQAFDRNSAITVYPMLLDKGEVSELFSRLDGELAYRGFANPDPFEFAGIREYQPFDSLRDINFRASAHTGELMANMHNPTVKGELDIILCFKRLEKNTAFEQERFEYSISLAATIAEHYITNGFAVGLYCNGKNALGEGIYLDGGIGDGQLQAVYECLARVGYDSCEDVATLTQDRYSNCAVFISPTVDKSVLEVYNKITEKYSTVKWLYPTMVFDVSRTLPPVEDAEIMSVPPNFGSYKE
jgi:uncharacterized protein (DUF58 family)